ncbi:MAG: homogentisate 1,2-dioxygenase [Dehalococcoidia bacterium]|nr:MAG: homogentisate 1,2-dioxygenase [Dehalococcoidia bacterium]
MPIYHRLGTVPPKRHIQFRRPDGRLYYEQVFGAEGFSGPYSILYHCNLPPQARRIEEHPPLSVQPWDEPVQRHHHLRTGALPAGGDVIGGRHVLLFNDEVSIAIARPTEPMTSFFKNGTADELYYVHHGEGVLRTLFGRIPFRPGDYLVIPRGTIYQLEFTTSENCVLIFEAQGAIQIPRRYRNEYGQLLEHAPYWQRDLRPPVDLETHDERGEYILCLKTGDRMTRYVLDYHPFDVVGWDGYLYPWAFNIHEFEPKAGRLHQPPPEHQTFEGPGFVICSFCPRQLEWDPRAVPLPYYHSNLDSDEVIFYSGGNYAARRGIGIGSITLHPRGIPHGPQPGTIEAALGKRTTDELAVMCDTFRPLRLTRVAAQIDDPQYPYSWLTSEQAP